jgi:hypothetical protein
MAGDDPTIELAVLHEWIESWHLTFQRVESERTHNDVTLGMHFTSLDHFNKHKNSAAER